MKNQLQKLVDGWDQLTDEDRTLIKDWLNDNQLTFQNLQLLPFTERRIMVNSSNGLESGAD